MSASESPIPHATITVSSGHLCFGALHNIWHGATSPLQTGFTSPRPESSGTVRAQAVEFNIAARNGIWNAFQLIDLATNEVAAWFLAHSDVDPEPEVDKILRVSGSPYEPDSGSNFNDDKTAAAGVFVINRYDWGWYDSRCKDEVVVPAVAEEDIPREPPFYGRFEAAGLVDHVAARDMVLRWKDQPSYQAEWSDHGAWLHIPGGEYMFGRFSFPASRTAAHAFLLFTTNTDFTRTVFRGLSRTLRKDETPKERFDRRLQEGHDFSGLELLNSLHHPSDNPSIIPLYPAPPPPDARLGPYPLKDHVLRAEDINAIRVYQNAEELKIVARDLDMSKFPPPGPIPGFVDPWAEPLYDLVNELVLAFLERTVAPQMGNRDVAAAAGLLFPRHETEKGKAWHLDAWCHRHFIEPDALPIPGFDAAYVSGRVGAFLAKLGEAAPVPVVLEEGCVKGITRAVAYLVGEVLEAASRSCYEAGEHVRIMPGEVRMGVYSDSQLYERLGFSRVLWEGREQGV